MSLSGLAIGSIYALIGIAYNVMYSASRVFSFTAGTLGMAGGILGSLFILKMGLPVWAGFLLALAGGALLGVVTEIVAVRPVLKSLDQHLYVLSTLALALIVQQFAAIEWGTDAQPFPRIFNFERSNFDQQFWLPMLACAITIVGLEMLYRRTLLGHAFLAIAEDNYAARALGLPERNLRMASYAHCRRDRRACGLRRRADAARLLRQRDACSPSTASCRSRSAEWATTAARWWPAWCSGCSSRPPTSSSAASSRPWRYSPSSFLFCWRAPRVSPEWHWGGASDGYVHHSGPLRAALRFSSSPAFSSALPWIIITIIALTLPLFAGGYWGVIATRACVYWVLAAGLNLLVGFAGQLAIGWVALLTFGAYVTSVLAAGNVIPALDPYLALAIAGVAGAVFGVIVGLPALRLRTFYFAITTLGFATIVRQIVLAWASVTGGGVGVPGSRVPRAVRFPLGLLLSLPHLRGGRAPG